MSVNINKTVQMVNISEEVLRIDIGGTPGDGVTQYELKPGEAAPFHENYCKPVPGAGTTPLPSILERQSTRTWADGVRRACLVPANEAKKVRREIDAQIEAWKKAGSPAPKPSAPEAPAR